MTVQIQKRNNDKLDSARRLLDLDVREISLVDRPAIKREFIVIKQLAADGNEDAVVMVAEFRKRFSGVEGVDILDGNVEKGSAEQNRLPDAAFAGISSGGKKDDDGKTTPRTKRHLPHHTGAVKSRTENTSIDKALLRNALARANQVKTTPALKARMMAHLRAHAKEVLPTSEAAQEAKKNEDILKALNLAEHYDLAEVGVENLPSELHMQLQKVKDGLEAANVDGIDQAVGFLSTILKGKLPVPKGEEMTISNQELGAAQGGDNVEKNAPPATEPNAGAEGTTPTETTKAEGAENQPPAQPEGGEQTVVRQKGVDPQDVGPTPAVQIMEDGSVHIAGQQVTKARSFTQARIDALTGNMEQLAGLLKDVAPEALEELVDKLAAEMPRDTRYRGAVRATPTPGAKKDKPKPGPMTKGEGEDGDDDGNDIANLTKAVQALTTKVETIEKARSPSTSVNDDGGTDDPNVQKAAPGSSAFWSGSLF